MVVCDVVFLVVFPRPFRCVIIIILFIIITIFYYLSKDMKIRYISFYLDFIINNRRLRDYKYYNTLEIIYKDIIN